MNNKIDTIKLIECPRDAMQGWPQFIPTHKKIAYINALIKVGFDTIDFGSFVSSKAIPQMADTVEVLKGLQLLPSTKLLAIVANLRGAEEALVYKDINYLGFPFSISPTFQLRNTNSTINESLQVVTAIQKRCVSNQKKLVIYISMAFGNIYGDAYNEGIVLEWVDKIAKLGIETISIADTVGVATGKQIETILKILIPRYPSIEFGVHLHSAASSWKDKAAAALQAGCLRFDGSLKGIGGCPMADDKLVGNMDTELMIPYFEQLGMINNIKAATLLEAGILANEIFHLY